MMPSKVVSFFEKCLWAMYMAVYDTVQDRFIPRQELFLEVQEEVKRLQPKKILDCGCGSGNLTRLLKIGDRLVVGIDSNTKMLRKARKRNPSINYTVGDLEKKWDLPDAYFNLIVTINTLYLLRERVVHNQKKTLVFFFEANKKLAKGGHIIVVTPKYPSFNILPFIRAHYIKQLQKDGFVATFLMSMVLFPQIFIFIGSNYLIKKISRVSGYKYYKIEELAHELSKAGFIIEKTKLCYEDNNIMLTAVKV